MDTLNSNARFQSIISSRHHLQYVPFLRAVWLFVFFFTGKCSEDRVGKIGFAEVVEANRAKVAPFCEEFYVPALCEVKVCVPTEKHNQFEFWDCLHSMHALSTNRTVRVGCQYKMYIERSGTRSRPALSLLPFQDSFSRISRFRKFRCQKSGTVFESRNRQSWILSIVQCR